MAARYFLHGSERFCAPRDVNRPNNISIFTLIWIRLLPKMPHSSCVKYDSKLGRYLCASLLGFRAAGAALVSGSAEYITELSTRPRSPSHQGTANMASESFAFSSAEYCQTFASFPSSTTASACMFEMTLRSGPLATRSACPAATSLARNRPPVTATSTLGAGERTAMTSMFGARGAPSASQDLSKQKTLRMCDIPHTSRLHTSGIKT